MKAILLSVILLTMTTFTSIYDFKVEGLEGNELNLSSYKGKKILIVNTASKCGLTPQYKELEELYKKHKDKLVIIGFPANNFNAQEPGSNKEIADFCERNYGVSFPMAAKVSVAGEDIAPIFKYLIAEAAKKGIKDPISWNFTKFLLNEKGELVTVFSPRTTPLSEEVLKAIAK